MKKIFLLVVLLSNITFADELVYEAGSVKAYKTCISGFYWVLFKENGKLIHAAQMYDIVKGGLATVPMPIRCKD